MKLMKTIVEIGFTVKAVSWDTVFITPISQVNGMGSNGKLVAW